MTKHKEKISRHDVEFQDSLVSGNGTRDKLKRVMYESKSARLAYKVSEYTTAAAETVGAIAAGTVDGITSLAEPLSAALESGAKRAGKAVVHVTGAVGTGARSVFLSIENLLRSLQGK
ncbi:hypothetical protein A3D88_03600 [Candidatus Peribacteria bacterium RIFCSPHIGHO2_02_FULL_52_16]|nr:MAG: hypothetical protein A2706_04415 [Candidatus Peribacteria bacterium RIFCSPHIGHO2_01_FULL_51_35]OGJ61768.1 MAG: hypothetical protein A3D88_03600 [Candidatus Peribacteria bacterium RIFCSPHIGHO2_02_FULL_52_16]